ncbi:MAG TPA: nickel transporter, partial [Methanoregula sp.]|nr:nickel transporter [Methanoregula sp.]
MDLVLAMDLRHNLVVHGQKGERAGYKPLDWGCSPTADPVRSVRAIRPKFLYIADLNRIEGTGSHDTVVRECAGLVSACYVDRGCRSPGDLLEGYHIRNVVGTETAGADLSVYT